MKEIPSLPSKLTLEELYLCNTCHYKDNLLFCYRLQHHKKGCFVKDSRKNKKEVINMPAKSKTYKGNRYPFVRTITGQKQQRAYTSMMRKLGYRIRIVRDGNKYHIYERSPK